MFDYLLKEAEKSKENWKKIQALVAKIDEKLAASKLTENEEAMFNLLKLVVNQIAPMYSSEEDISKLVDSILGNVGKK